MMDIAAGAQAQRYQYSGKLGRSMVLLPVLSVAAAALVAYLYSFLSSWIPVMKLKILVAIGAGLVVGVATSWIARRLLCRSPLYVGAVGLLAAVAAVYVSLVAYVADILGQTGSPPGFSTLVFDPDATWNYLVKINSSGLFQKNGRTMSTTSVWVDFGFEFIPYFFSIPITAWLAFKKSIFCEECLKWLDLKKNNLSYPLPADPLEIDRLKTGDLTLFGDKTPLSGACASFIRLDYVVCPTCGNTGTYRIVKVEGENHEKTLSGLMLLTPENVPALGALLAKKENTPPAKFTAPPVRSKDASETQR